MSYVLDNAEERERVSPESFEIPRREVRYALRVGDLVKLLFKDSETGIGERMWVEVTSVGTMDLATGRLPYAGILRNHPGEVDAKYGDKVKFAPEHVASLDRPYPETN